MATPRPRASAARDATTTTDKRTKRRSRPIPKWLSDSRELDEIAKRRCLMVLSVLSGERPVTDAIEELSLSRGTYYQLEQRALEAMLAALVPGASTNETSSATPQKRIAELEAKVTTLEQQKRRTERLLYLARQVVGTGPVTMTGRGRPKKVKSRRRSKTAGSSSSTRSASKTRTSSSSTTARTTAASSSPASTFAPSTPAEVSTSIPTPAGEDAR